jgi:hypothetical protein
MEQMNQYEHEMTKGDDRPTLDKQSKPSFQTFAAPKASPDILDSPKKPVEVKSDIKGPVKGKPEPKNDDSKPAEQASLKLVTYCPNCSTPYTYTKGQEGQSAKCRKCGTSITIPKL